MVVVAAAGNSYNTNPHYPAYYDNAIAVAATDSNDNKTNFSTYGGWIDIAAPGKDILSLRAQGTDMYEDEEHFHGEARKYYIASGTSMACPHVAGLSGLILSYRSNFNPDQVRQVLRVSADDKGPKQGFDIETGYGRINAHKALLMEDVFEVRIANYYEDMDTGEVVFEGNAWGEEDKFDYYVLEYGKGEVPTKWDMIKQSTTRRKNEELGRIHLSLITELFDKRENTVTIRLRAFHKNEDYEFEDCTYIIKPSLKRCEPDMVPIDRATIINLIDAIGESVIVDGEESIILAVDEPMENIACRTPIRQTEGSVMVEVGHRKIPSLRATLSEGLRYFKPEDQFIELASTLNVPRWCHLACKLADGNVLIIGGIAEGARRTAEIYDPATESFRLLSKQLPIGLSGYSYEDEVIAAGHDPFLLDDGRVIIIWEGEGDLEGFGVIEFNPNTEEFILKKSLRETRNSWERILGVTMLADEKILITGAEKEGNRKRVLLYDPATNELEQLSMGLHKPRKKHRLVLLDSGNVLIIGGEDFPSSAEIFEYNSENPHNSASREIMDSPYLSKLRSINLENQEVLFGEVVFDEITERFIEKTNKVLTCRLERDKQVLIPIVIRDEYILMEGSYFSPSFIEYVPTNVGQIYDPHQVKAMSTDSMHTERAYHTATLLDDGDVLITGGVNIEEKGLDSVEVFSVSPLRIRTVMPAEGLTSGGTEVNIKGYGFQQGCQALFRRQGTEIVVSPEWISEDKDIVRIITPSFDSGYVDVGVRNLDGSEAWRKEGFWYGEDIVFHSMDPSEGDPTGGYRVNIKGEGFQRGCKVFTYWLTELPPPDDLMPFGDVKYISSEELEVMVNSFERCGGCRTPLIIRNPDGTNLKTKEYFEFSQSFPVILGVAPNNGPREGGTEVTITGKDFELGEGFEVIFKCIIWDKEYIMGAEVIEVTPELVRVISPAMDLEGADAVYYDPIILLKNPDGGLALKNKAFLYDIPVTSVHPPKGCVEGGTYITITGEDLNSLEADMVVFRRGDVIIDKVYAGFISDNAISIYTPATDTLGYVDIGIERGDGFQGWLLDGFEYIDCINPKVDGFSPRYGLTTGGDTISVQGADFQPGCKVVFQNEESGLVIDATNTRFISETSLEALTPAISVEHKGRWIVGVANPDGGKGWKRSPGYWFRYIDPEDIPVVTKITPEKLPSIGGIVILQGKSLDNVSRAMVQEIDGAPKSWLGDCSIDFSSDDTLRLKVPELMYVGKAELVFVGRLFSIVRIPFEFVDYGDVNSDTAITQDDMDLLLDYICGKVARNDINVNNSVVMEPDQVLITLADAEVLNSYLDSDLHEIITTRMKEQVGIEEWRWPVEFNGERWFYNYDNVSTVNLSISDAEVAPGEEAEVLIKVEPLFYTKDRSTLRFYPGFSAISFSLGYDPSILDFSAIEASSAGYNQKIEYQDNGEGRVFVSLVSSDRYENKTYADNPDYNWAPLPLVRVKFNTSSEWDGTAVEVRIEGAYNLTMDTEGNIIGGEHVEDVRNIGNEKSYIYVGDTMYGEGEYYGYNYQKEEDLVGTISYSALNMALNEAPEIEEIADQEIYVWQRLKVKVSANDPEGKELIYSGKNLPRGASINSKTGELRWNPIRRQVGDHRIEIEVSDGEKVSSTTINIKVRNRSMVRVLDGRGKPVRKKVVEVLDERDKKVTTKRTNKRGKASFKSEEGKKYRFRVEHEGKYYYSKTFVAPKDVTIRLPIKNIKAPVITEIEDQDIYVWDRLKVKVKARDPEGAKLTYRGKDLPKGASINKKTGVFKWKPYRRDVGTHSIEIEVSDGEKSSSTSINVKVRNRSMVTVLDGARKPVVKKRVEVLDERGRKVKVKKTNKRGKASFKSEEGKKYKFRVKHKGHYYFSKMFTAPKDVTIRLP